MALNKNLITAKMSGKYPNIWKLNNTFLNKKESRNHKENQKLC